jgi:hypothetical protein
MAPTMINTNPPNTIHPVHESDDATALSCLVLSLVMPSKMLLFRRPIARDSGVFCAVEHHPIQVINRAALFVMPLFAQAG